MSYFKRRNLVDQVPVTQRNRFLKFITLVLLGASASMLLANADLVINPQVSNSSAYMKQFFITSDGTSNSSVGALLQGSGVFSKTFCNLSGTACKTIEELFALDSQLANLLPADNGEYALYASGGKILTGGLRSTVAGYSLPTKLAIGFVTPSNALDVLGSAYISGSVQVMGSLVSSLLTGVATINGINIGDFVTLAVMDAKGYLTGSQVDARIALQINALSGVITSTYYTAAQVDAKGYLTGGQVNTLAKTLGLSCSDGQTVKYNTASSSWQCGSDQVGGGVDLSLYATIAYVTGSYYDKTSSDAKYLTGGSVNLLAKAPGLSCTEGQIAKIVGGVWTCAGDQIGAGIDLSSYATIAYVTGSYYDKTQSDAKYLTGGQVSSNETDPKIGTLTSGKWCTTNGSTISCTTNSPLTSELDPNFSSWYNSSPQIGFWTEAYGWGNHAAAGYLTSESDPKIGTLTNGKWCTSNGTTISCTSDAPVGGSSGLPSCAPGYMPIYYDDGTNYGWECEDPSSWNTAFSWGDHADAGYLTGGQVSSNETDPKIGTLTSGKWCTTNGSTISCTTNSPLTSELDPNFSSWYNSSPQIGFWTEAYGWGNHAAAGYLTSESDPKVGTLTSGKWCTTNGSTISCTTNSPLTSELDPNFSSWYNSSPQIGFWTEAYGWGNHATAGYLTSETDPDFSSWLGNATYLITDWDAAYIFKNNASTNNRLVIDTGNNRVGIGTGAPGYKLTVNGTGLFTNSVFAEAFLYNSDKRLKTNILAITDPLVKISQLHGYTFDWKASGKHDIGVIAQEVEAVFPEAVVTKDDGFKTVNYPSLVAPIIEAIKALYTKYLDQQYQIDDLKTQVAELKMMLSQSK